MEETRQTTQRKSKCFKLSRKIKFILFHSFDSFFLIAIQLIQGFVLDYYIESHYNKYPYVLYGLDIFCSFIFALTLYTSFKYLSYHIDNDTYPDKRDFVVSPKRIMSQFPTSKLGMLPLSYISWLIYILILFIKITILFGEDLFVILHEHNKFTPQLLKIMIGLSSIVFLLLVEAHNRLELNSDRYAYVTSVCSKVGVEIFDSVSLLSVLLMKDQLPRTFEQSVCVLAGINFLLPALFLYRLSLSDKLFSEYNNKYPIQLFHHIIRTLCIEIPFLTVRLYLWISFEEEASIFMMKNIYNIFVSMRNIHPELVEYLNRDDVDKGITSNGNGGQCFEEIVLNPANTKISFADT